MKKIIVAIDSFKGCLTSAEANQAAAEGILQPEGRSVARNLAKIPEAEVVQVPVSDGGEGWLEAFYAAMGGSIVEVNVKDPLMRTIVAQYLVQGDTAVIEIAKASGLTLLKAEERNPMVATSYGTGQLINKEYGEDENAFDRCMEITKRSRDYFKEAMRREDYYRNSMLLMGVDELLTNGYLTIDDIFSRENRFFLYSNHVLLQFFLRLLCVLQTNEYFCNPIAIKL